MAGISQDHVAVPATTETDLKYFRLREKTGRISIHLHAVIERDNIPASAKAGKQLDFKVYESDDRGKADAWVVISGGSFISVKPGGQQVVNVLSQKRYIKITGKGVNGSGYARLDAMYNGIQYHGQIDEDVIGKSGFSKDSVALDADLGNADFTGAAWPE